MQAATGLMSVTGEPDGPPVRAGVSLIDFATGQWAAIGILAALLEREHTGVGRTIDTSLYETALALLSSQIAAFAATGEAPGRHGSAFPLIAPYEVFPTSDGALMIVAGSDGLYERLRGVLDLPDDERFRTNPDRVRNRDGAGRAALGAAAHADERRVGGRARGRRRARHRRLRDVGEAFAHEQTQRARDPPAARRRNDRRRRRSRRRRARPPSHPAAAARRLLRAVLREAGTDDLRAHLRRSARGRVGLVLDTHGG